MTTEAAPKKPAKTPAAKATERNLGGRPPFPDKPDVQRRICELISEGKSLREICAMPEMPERQTVIRWCSEDEAFRDQYARAREHQADYYADEITSIADNATDANIARLQIDARKWIAGKLRPKAYGDKVTNEHVGKDGEAIQVNDVSSDARKVAYMLGRAVGRLGKAKSTDVAQS